LNDNRVRRIQGHLGQSEGWLQRYLANHPELLPTVDLDGIESELRLIGRELAAIDLLFVDERGLLTVVETKLFKNPEARREVIAQLQDYAAQLSKLDVLDLCELIARLHGSKAIEGLGELEKLVKLLSKYVSSDDGFRNESADHAKAVLAHYVVEGKISDSQKLSQSETRFLEKLDLMLKEGSFRLVIVTDRATPSLLDLLNYVNSTMKRGHQLVALELSTVDIKGDKYFVPHLVGSSNLLSAEYYREEKGYIRRKWGEQEFLNKLPQDLRKDVSQLIELLKSSNHFWHNYGTGKETGRLLLGVNLPKEQSRAFLSIKTTGMVSLHEGFLKKLIHKSQKYKLLSKIKSRPFLQGAYRTMERLMTKPKFNTPIVELKDCGREGERAENILQLLEDFYEVVNIKK
jgi:hypothetical protein